MTSLHLFEKTSGEGDIRKGIPDEVEDGVSFEEKMSELTMALGEQMRERQLLDEEIKQQLLKVGFIVSDELVDF